MEMLGLVESGVFYIAITSIAPIGEISKRENYWMRIIWVFSLMLEHVRVNIAAACNYTASWFETKPVFT